MKQRIHRIAGCVFLASAVLCAGRVGNWWSPYSSESYNWYMSLVKPCWSNEVNLLLAGGLAIHIAMAAIACVLLLRKGWATTAAVIGPQLVLSLVWSNLFFVNRSIGLALIAMMGIAFLAIWTIRLLPRQRWVLRVIVGLYIIGIIVYCVTNGTIWVMNAGVDVYRMPY